MTRAIRRWSKQELVWLEQNYKDLTAKEMAQGLGRTAASVKGKINEMVLKKLPDDAVAQTDENGTPCAGFVQSEFGSERLLTQTGVKIVVGNVTTHRLR